MIVTFSQNLLLLPVFFKVIITLEHWWLCSYLLQHKPITLSGYPTVQQY